VVGCALDGRQGDIEAAAGAVALVHRSVTGTPMISDRSASAN
jgi:hypothetical protein